LSRRRPALDGLDTLEDRFADPDACSGCASVKHSARSAAVGVRCPGSTSSTSRPSVPSPTIASLAPARGATIRYGVRACPFCSFTRCTTRRDRESRCAHTDERPLRCVHVAETRTHTIHERAGIKAFPKAAPSMQSGGVGTDASAALVCERTASVGRRMPRLFNPFKEQEP
jgi:hypothetical protein